MLMSGWKTWMAVGGFVLLGVYDLANGDVDAAMIKFTSALGILGIGHKVEKSK